jgi:hypothetical protein
VPAAPAVMPLAMVRSADMERFLCVLDAGPGGLCGLTQEAENAASSAALKAFRSSGLRLVTNVHPFW